MKGDAVFKRVFNETLDRLAERERGANLPSENGLREQLGTSRTTVRKVLAEMTRREIVGSVGNRRVLLRGPKRADYFDKAATLSTSSQVEKKFLEWMLRGDRKPGEHINGLDLARQFNVSTGAVREYLNRFGRFGLIERRPNSSWAVKGFTREFALELFEVRELFEMRSAIRFAAQPAEAPAWESLRKIEREHHELLAEVDERFHDFSDLDERFHRLINDASRNRFFVDFYELISLIFHYHYQWNKSDEAERNRVAIEEHIAYIEALSSGEPERVSATCHAHLKSARETLLASLV